MHLEAALALTRAGEIVYHSHRKSIAHYVYCLAPQDGQGFRIGWAPIQRKTLMRPWAFSGQGS